MKILAYDTSGQILTAALVKDGRLLCEMESDPKVRHSSTLVPLLEMILKKAKWNPLELDVLAVGIGPGSFTGIRVGVATAKMLGFVWGTKLVGVSSLEAVARASKGPDGRFPVVMDARRGKVYAALFEKKEGKFTERLAPALTTTEEFFKRAGGPVAVLDKPAVRAADIAFAAHARALTKKFQTPDSLQPLYLHPKDCNVTLPKK